MPTKDLKPVTPLTTALQNSHGPGMAVQTYVQAIRSYADMQVDALLKVEDFQNELGEAGKKAAEEGLDALKQINTHLAAAREHGNTWDLLVKDMFSTNADVRKVGKDVLKNCGEAQTMVKNAEGKGKEEIQSALKFTRDSLQTIEAVVKNRADHASTLATSLDSFKNQVMEDYRNFSSDGTKVSAVLTGDQSWIKSINDEIDALHSAINKDNWMIAGGAVAIAAGVVVGIVGGVLIATGVGTGVGLMVIGAGVAIAGAGIATTVIGAVDLNKKKEKLADDEKKLTLLKASVATFQNAQKTVDSLAKQAGEAAKGAEQLSLAWKDLAANLKEAAEAIDDVLNADLDTLEATLHATGNLLGTAMDTWKDVDNVTNVIEKGMRGLQDDPKKFVDTVQLAA